MTKFGVKLFNLAIDPRIWGPTLKKMRTQRMQGYILKLIWAISYSAWSKKQQRSNCHRYLGSQHGTLNIYMHRLNSHSGSC